MSSTANIDMSTVTLEGLCAKIEKGKESKTDNEPIEFVPETVLAGLINQKAVENVLQHSTGHGELQLAAPISVLAEFFSKEAFKVFAILAMNHHFPGAFNLPLLDHLYQKGFRDDMLPVQKRSLKTGWEIESCNRNADPDKIVREAFRYGDGSPWGKHGLAPWTIDQFYQSWQWPFVPPVFFEDKFRYEFPYQIRLPFTRSGERKKSDSFYSYVEDKSIHVDHIPRDLVRAPRPSMNPLQRLRAY
jgi:hypothetical protein